jgi:motility quorum-sensing regulator / GCU-specific mRNA interferase toxin
MEKRTPHCKLYIVKTFVQAGKVRTTHTARTGANELGLSFSDMLDVVMALTPTDFYKSMTTHAITRYGRMCTAPARWQATFT